MKTADLIFVDTNILIYAADTQSPFQPQAKRIREQGLRGTVPLCLSPQVLYEFYATVTNPKRMYSPLSQQEAIQEIRKYYESKDFCKLYPSIASVDIVLRLLNKYTVTKQKVHDLHLVATMIEYGVSKIYTFNQKDFEPFSEINVLSPDSVLQ